MSHRSEDHGDGRITTEKTVWCALCEHWSQQPAGGHAAEWKARGWRRTKQHGWVCRGCIRARRHLTARSA